MCSQLIALTIIKRALSECNDFFNSSSSISGATLTMSEQHAHESYPLLPRQGSLASVPLFQERPVPDAQPDAAIPLNERHSVLEVIAENVEGFVEGAHDAAVDILESAQEYAGDIKDAFVEAAVDTKETLVSIVEDASEAVAEEFQEVADAFIEELEDADEEMDKTFLLEMTLTRNLSILPADMVDSAAMVPSMIPFPNPDCQAEDEETGEGDEETLKDEDNEIEKAPMSAYFLLASAVISLSSIGPLLDLQNDVSGTMKIYWRTTATALLLLPFAVSSICREGFPRLSWPQWVVLLMTSGSYAAMCVFFVWALDYTAVGNAVIFSNSQALILLVGKAFIGEAVSMLEGSGALVAFSGAIMCSKDSSDTTPEDPGGFTTVLGDCFAISSAFSGVVYLVLAKTVRTSMDLYVFMFFIMFIGSLQTLLFLFIAREPYSIDRDPNTGVFGWTAFEQDRLPLELFMVVICNLFGAMGYVRAMHYFDNLVISVAALMEPVVAEFLAFTFGVGFLPGWLGWLGNFLVVCGTFAVVYQPPGRNSVPVCH